MADVLVCSFWIFFGEGMYCCLRTSAAFTIDQRLQLTSSAQYSYGLSRSVQTPVIETRTCVLTSQIQTLMQIMVNRISLIMYNDRKAFRLKIAVLIIITILNIGVMVIWVPAQLGINRTFETANQVWHRIEKSIFLNVDAALNVYFIHLVRSELIQPGLTKYKSLYRFNLAMVAVSVALDVAVIGVVSVPDPEVSAPWYHPVRDER